MYVCIEVAAATLHINVHLFNKLSLMGSHTQQSLRYPHDPCKLCSDGKMCYLKTHDLSINVNKAVCIKTTYC